MTADERYEQCTSRKELDEIYHYDRLSADTWEFLSACDKAYAKHYERLYKQEMACDSGCDDLS